jgi:hypothetical protein
LSKFARHLRTYTIQLAVFVDFGVLSNNFPCCALSELKVQQFKVQQLNDKALRSVPPDFPFHLHPIYCPVALFGGGG